MQIGKNEIHVYAASLSETISEERFAILSQDDRERAARLISPLHQQRFIAAHVILRELLGLYLNITPASLQFKYNDFRKPSLAAPFAGALQFNLSHSEDLAVYALTLLDEIGIDIEKISSQNKIEIAERFFSDAEKAALAALPPEEQAAGFYRVWARKEAIIKANGKGLAQPLSSFSVSIEDQQETVRADNQSWYLMPLPIHPDFAGAIATAQPKTNVMIWDMINHKPVSRTENPGVF